MAKRDFSDTMSLLMTWYKIFPQISIALLIFMVGFVLPIAAQNSAGSWTVKPEWVLAHEAFLASDSMQGRGSATHDEEVAAVYVASQFISYGLKAAPGMPGMLETLKVESRRTNGHRVMNVVGYLAGTDPTSGTLLLSAHLDHIGVHNSYSGDDIYNGANDDASGVTAVLELAHALTAGPPPKRSILFVCFGGEEIGEIGSSAFAEHPPIPLDQIAANLEFEMIGYQDPDLQKGMLMVTGWERSNLGSALKEHGAKLAPDAHPFERFFERSDNYALALKGVVAHTIAGWGTPPTYHRPNDDIHHLDFDFMTAAIQSLIEPVQWLASSDFKPQWNKGGKPSR